MHNIVILYMHEIIAAAIESTRTGTVCSAEALLTVVQVHLKTFACLPVCLACVLNRAVLIGSQDLLLHDEEALQCRNL